MPWGFRSSTLAVAGFVLAALVFQAPALATPDRGFDCRLCHGGQAAPDSRISLVGADGTANPTEPPGGTDRGTLPVFQVAPGQTETIEVRLNNLLQPGDDHVHYDLSLTDAYQRGGFATGENLSYTGDWHRRTDTAGMVWYHLVEVLGTPPNIQYEPFEWHEAIPHRIRITPAATAREDFYEFAMSWAGGRGRPGGEVLDAGRVFFLVQVVPEPASLSLLALGAAALLRRRRG